MKGYLGEFEELVLLTIATLGGDAYGVAIKEEIQKRANRSISIGALHSTISRLEDKGYLKSHLGGATAERGGRKKRFFELTADAKEGLTAMKELRDSLWSASQVNLNISK
ncbi:MAG: helix-turn-helix transcriptional regulator [Fulvivirga sp.]|uniref:PadR family transcriptional regulator n=1 Tax=Fulvivirga sp. TaxID=1931237 RepID=UPI0032EBBA13